MKWHRELAVLVVVVAALATVATAKAATTPVPSTTDDPAWLKAHGLAPEATVTVADEPADYKLPDRCWHARVFAGLRATYGERKWAVWAWSKGIVCSYRGHIQEFHQRHGKGSNQSWTDGPYPSLTDHTIAGDRMSVFSYYKTDWKMGYANWGVKLALRQWWSKRVDRNVHWTHYASS